MSKYATCQVPWEKLCFVFFFNINSFVRMFILSVSLDNLHFRLLDSVIA